MDEIRKLSQTERNHLVTFITQIDSVTPLSQHERILGLGKDDSGFWISADFDDELPDSFWYSDNDILSSIE